MVLGYYSGRLLYSNLYGDILTIETLIGGMAKDC